MVYVLSKTGQPLMPTEDYRMVRLLIKNKLAVVEKRTLFTIRLTTKSKECFIWGRRSTGSLLLKLLDGTKVKDGVSYKKLKLLERSSNYLIA